MNERRGGLLLTWAPFLLGAACHRGSLPPCMAIPAPASLIVVAPTAPPAVDSDSTQPFERYAERVYANISAKRWNEAEALLASQSSEEDGCSSSLGEWTGTEGRLLSGSRVVVELSASGAVLSHRVVDGCVVFADRDLVAYVRGGDAFIEAESTRWSLRIDQNTSPLHVSASWVLAVGSNGHFLAWRRTSGEFVGGTYEGNPFPSAHGAGPVGGTVAGKYMIVASKPGRLVLHRADGGAPAPIAGCPGTRLLAALAPSDDGLLLHVGGDEESAETRLCFVDRNGRTTRVAELGAATCGLAGPVPCAWTLAAAASTMLAFGSYRGHLKLVDARAGHELRIVLPAGTHTEGGSPSGFFACETGICATLEEDGSELAQVETTVTRKGNDAVFSPRVPPTRPRWCLRNQLPVPPVLCHD